MALLRPEAQSALVQGMKKAGVSVVTSLPTHQIVNLYHAVEDEPGLNHVPVANEGDAVGICSGAWLGGGLGALIAQENGMILATYHLLGTMDHFGGFPMVMLLDMPGHHTFKENSPPHFYYYAMYAPKIMEAIQLPYSVVTDVDKVEGAIQATANHARGLMRPAALIIAGDLYEQED